MPTRFTSEKLTGNQLIHLVRGLYDTDIVLNVKYSRRLEIDENPFKIVTPVILNGQTPANVHAFLYDKLRDYPFRNIYYDVYRRKNGAERHDIEVELSKAAFDGCPDLPLVFIDIRYAIPARTACSTHKPKE